MKLPHVFFLSLFPMITGSVSGATIVSDGFNDGDRTNGADLLDVSWNKTTSGSTLAVINTDPVMSGNVLRMSPGGALNAITATMPTVNLGVGESLSLSFTFRYTVTPAANGAGLLRLGLYNNNGGETLGDTATNVTDGSGWKADGYYANLRSGPGDAPTGTDRHEIFRETEDNNAILAGNRSSIGPVSGSGITTPGISDTAAHNISFQVLRNGANSYYISAFIDGNLMSYGTDTSGLTISTFDTIAISTGANTNPWIIDDLSVVYTVPEPSVALLGLLGVPFFFRRRR